MLCRSLSGWKPKALSLENLGLTQNQHLLTPSVLRVQVLCSKCSESDRDVLESFIYDLISQ